MNFTSTSIFTKAIDLLQISLETLKNLSTEDFCSKLDELEKFDDDEKFEIIVQFESLKKHVAGNERKVQEDRIIISKLEEVPAGAAPMTQKFSPNFPNKSETCGGPSKPRTQKIKTRKTFGGMKEMMSKKGQQILFANNLTNQSIFAHITESQVKNLRLSGSDEKIVKQIMLQCRSTMVKNRIEMANKSQMPKNCITDRLPIKSSVTIKVLKKANLLCPVKLYISTKVSEILSLFARFPAIPAEDKKNILAGTALARYTHKNC